MTTPVKEVFKAEDFEQPLNDGSSFNSIAAGLAANHANKILNERFVKYYVYLNQGQMMVSETPSQHDLHCILGTQLMTLVREEKKVGILEIEINPWMPPEEIHFKDSKGKIVGKIVGIKP